MELDVEGAEMEEVEVEGVYFEVKGRRLRRCSLRLRGGGGGGGGG